jgi:hypothetical protein
VGAATLAADQSVQGGARATAFALPTIDTLGHFLAAPPASAFGGATNP